MAMATSSYAEDNSVSELQKYEFNVNDKMLSKYLSLNEDQTDAMSNVMAEFSNCMRFASLENVGESRNKVAANAVKRNIQHASYILNEKQMKNYLMVLNATLVNRGFDLTKFSVVSR